MMLSRRQRNQVYETIVKSELDPAEFDLEDTGAEVVITHNSGSSFKFSRTEEPSWEVPLLGEKKYSPIEIRTKVRYKFTARVSEGIDQVGIQTGILLLIAGNIQHWLDEIRLTVGVPDHWAEMQRNRKLIARIERTESANTPFTKDEKRQIAARLQEIKKQVREQFELTNEQMGQIEETLDEVVEANTRMGRKDWLIYFLGTITALIITATVTAGVGEHIFAMFIHALGHLFTGGNEPPHLLS
jgi:hypothetical protein